MDFQHLTRQSADGGQINQEALYAIAPSAFTETRGTDGRLRRTIDWDKLRALLGDTVEDNSPEMYQFTWPGKREAQREAARPINKTLRPVPSDSVDWNTTQNLYIEGDNLEVLKLLQRSYLGRVKMIYIDPPYNTGNDFVYHDDFAHTQAETDEAAGNVNELGGRFVKNQESNGKFHSDWCSMIYSRLLVARNLLTEDGVIFISIDDNEVDNLKKICNDVFGENNLIACITVKGNPRGRQSNTYFADVNDYLIVCRKSTKLEIQGFEISPETADARFNKIDENGVLYEEWELRKRGADSRREDSPNLWYPIYYNPETSEISTSPISNNDIVITPKLSDGADGRWRWSKAKVESEKNTLYVRQVRSGAYNIFERKYLSDKSRQLAPTMWDYKDVNTELGTKLIKKLFNSAVFDYPKPVGLIQRILELYPQQDFIFLDFFSGCATSAHGVLLKNAEDGGNRTFIMVQLPEETAEDSEARKAGYQNICEIGKERIRRAAKKIKEEKNNSQLSIFNSQLPSLDTGFRVFRLDSSNYEDVELSPALTMQDQLNLFEDNIKADRTDLDLLFGAMLSWGVQLSLPMTTETVDGCNIYTVNDGDLVACFDPDMSDNVIRTIADKSPLRILFRDSCFTADDQKINIFEQFKQLLDWDEKQALDNIRVI